MKRMGRNPFQQRIETPRMEVPVAAPSPTKDETPQFNFTPARPTLGHLLKVDLPAAWYVLKLKAWLLVQDRIA